MRPRFGWALIPIVLAAGHWQSALAQEKPTASAEPSSPQIQSETGAAPFDVPAGTRVVLQLTGPVWTKSATPGIRVYARSVFPVAINNAMVIPAGTYVEGIVDAVKKPTRRSNRAQFQMHFTKWIFANGYTVQFVGSDSAKATANLLVEVSYASDVLLDNGTQIEMTVQKPILLDRASIAKAAQVRSEERRVGKECG